MIHTHPRQRSRNKKYYQNKKILKWEPTDPKDTHTQTKKVEKKKNSKGKKKKHGEVFLNRFCMIGKKKTRRLSASVSSKKNVKMLKTSKNDKKKMERKHFPGEKDKKKEPPSF